MTDYISAPQTMSKMTPPSRIMRLPEVINRVGLSRASVYLYITKNAFPKPVSLGARAVGWLESDIDGWIAARIEVTSRQHRQ